MAPMHSLIGASKAEESNVGSSFAVSCAECQCAMHALSSTCRGDRGVSRNLDTPRHLCKRLSVYVSEGWWDDRGRGP